MTDQEKDKLIVEALGECLHTDNMQEVKGRLAWGNCPTCGKKAFKINLNLATPEGFFWIWERAQKMEWWVSFIEFYTEIYARFDESYNSAWKLIEIINPTRFRDALAEFLEGRK